MVNFILIRHGESKDNLRGVWAGWKDAPLSNHGMRQAEALAKDLSSTKLSIIYSSDLTRAKTTAKAIKQKQLYNDVPHRESTSLREQHFGKGEGMKFTKKEPGKTLAEHFYMGEFPALHTRHDCFPEGESLDDVARRAETVVDEIVFPHVLQEQTDGMPRTMAIVSHGIFISELIAAILRRDHDRDPTRNTYHFRGMRNTAWTGIEVKRKSSNRPPTMPNLTVKITGVNQDTHLLDLHRQKGGIGSMAHDPNQLDIRTLFGKKVASKPPRKKPYSDS